MEYLGNCQSAKILRKTLYCLLLNSPDPIVHVHNWEQPATTTLKLNSNHKGKGLVIQNSSVGSIQTGPGFNITLMDSYIDGSERIQETFLESENSNVSIINSTFEGNMAHNKTIIINGAKWSNISIIVLSLPGSAHCNGINLVIISKEQSIL